MTDATMLPQPATRMLAEERRRTQSSMNDYFNSIGFQFESKAFIKLCNSFFERPWDGVKYLTPVTNQTLDSSNVNDSGATDDRAASTAKELDSKAEINSRTLQATSSPSKRESTDVKDARTVTDFQALSSWPSSGSLSASATVSDIFQIPQIQTSRSTTIQLRSNCSEQMTNQADQSHTEGLRFLSVLRKKLAQGFQPLGTMAEAPHFQIFNITVESLQPRMSVIARIRGSIRTGYSGRSSLMGLAEEPADSHRDSIILDNSSTNTMTSLELVGSDAVCVAMDVATISSNETASYGILLVITAKLKQFSSARKDSTNITSTDLQEGIYFNSIEISLSKVHATLRNARVAMDGKCVSLSQLQQSTSVRQSLSPVCSFLVLSSTGMIFVCGLDQTETAEQYHTLVIYARVYCGSIYPTAFSRPELMKTVASPFSSRVGLIPKFIGAMNYSENESICTLVAVIGEESAAPSRTSRFYYTSFGIVRPCEIGGFSDWKALDGPNITVESVDTISQLLMNLKEKPVSELIPLMNMAAGLSMKTEYCRVIKELLFIRMADADQCSNLCDFFVGSFLSDWRGQECSDAALLGRDYMCIGWSKILLRNMGLSSEVILMEHFVERMKWNEALVASVKYLLEQYSESTTPNSELVAQVEGRRIEEEISKVVEAHNLVSISRGDSEEGQESVLRSRLYLALVETLLTCIIYRYNKVVKPA